MLGQYQQFTNERELLRRAVSRLSVRERIASGALDTPRISPYQAELIDSNDPDSLELAVQEIMPPSVSTDARRPEWPRVALGRSSPRTIRSQRRPSRHLKMSSVTCKSLPGRKVMVLVSDGFLLGGMRDGRHFDLRRNHRRRDEALA
jgi:hypothetical protein